MKTEMKAKKIDVLRWADTARLDLPDHWSGIRGKLETQQPNVHQKRDNRMYARKKQRWILVTNGILLLMVCGIAFSIYFRNNGAHTTKSASPTYADATTAGMTNRSSVATTTAATTTATTTGATVTQILEQNDIDELSKAEIKSQTGDLRIYQDVIPWSEYSTAQIHRAEVNVSGNMGSGLGCFMIDSNLNLYLELFNGDISRYPDNSTTLGVFNLTDGSWHPFFEASSQNYGMSFRAENEKYIVWQEGIPSYEVLLDPVIHVYVRNSGEDIRFTMPITHSTYYGNHSVASSMPILILEDSVYLDAFTKGTPGASYQDLYRFDIVTRTLERVETDTTSPFLYDGKLAWFKLDYPDLDHATAMTASGAIAGLPTIPVKYANNAIVCGGRIILRDWSDLILTENGKAALIIADTCTSHIIYNPQATGNIIAFNIWGQDIPLGWDAPKYIFDIDRSVLVDLSNQIGDATFFGFFGNRMFFIDRNDTTADTAYTATIYWIDLAELG